MENKSIEKLMESIKKIIDVKELEKAYYLKSISLFFLFFLINYIIYKYIDNTYYDKYIPSQIISLFIFSSYIVIITLITSIFKNIVRIYKEKEKENDKNKKINNNRKLFEQKIKNLNKNQKTILEVFVENNTSIFSFYELRKKYANKKLENEKEDESKYKIEILYEIEILRKEYENECFDIMLSLTQEGLMSYIPERVIIERKYVDFEDLKRIIKNIDK